MSHSDNSTALIYYIREANLISYQNDCASFNEAHCITNHGCPALTFSSELLQAMLANAAVSTFFPCHPLELLITWNKIQLLTLTANDKITKRDKVHRCKELLNINSVLIHETLQQNYINWLIMTTSVTDTTTTAKCQFHQVSYNNVCS